MQTLLPGTVAKRQLRKTEIERVLDGEQDNDAQAENRRHARNERASKRHDVEQVLASDDELTVRKKKSTRTIVNHEDTTIAAGSKAEEVMTRKRLGTVGDGDDEDDDGFADSPGLKRIRRA